MKPARSILFLIGAALVAGTALAQGPDQWPQFRGLHSGAIPDNPALPDTWSEVENVAWKTAIPGLGWSSPIVWNDLIFVTAVISTDPMPVPGLDIFEEGQTPSYRGGGTKTRLAGEYRWVLYAVDFNSGKVKWERELFKGTPREKRHAKNSYASETPVTDGKHVYVFHSSAGRLFAVDFNGKLAWSKEVAAATVRTDVVTKAIAMNEVDAARAAAGGWDREHTAMFTDMGAGASPTLHKDRIIVTADHEARVWMMTALSTADGRELWRVEEPKLQASYGWSTPFIWENAQRTEIIAAGDLRVRSFDLNGKLLWHLKGLSPNTMPTPVSADGMLYVTSGFASTPLRPIFAIRPGAAGDISLKDGETSNQYIAWYQRQGASYIPSALVYRDTMYNLYSRGFLTAHDAKTGSSVYGRQRVDREVSSFSASPWAYNGKIFASSEDGITYVIEAGKNYQLVRKNIIDGMILATPAVVRDSVILRTSTALYRIKKK